MNSEQWLVHKRGVVIYKDRKGKGRIVIEHHTVNDYQRVVGTLKKQ